MPPPPIGFSISVDNTIILLVTQAGSMGITFREQSKLTVSVILSQLKQELPPKNATQFSWVRLELDQHPNPEAALLYEN